MNKHQKIVSKMLFSALHTYAVYLLVDNTIRKFQWIFSAEMNSYPEANRVVWMDLEFTGLDIKKDKIMEIACLVTDSNLNIIAEGPNIIIGHSKDVLQNMNEWCVHHHKKSGLTKACLDSDTTIEEAEVSLLDFLSKYVMKNASPLAGNSVHVDRLFLKKFMPKLDDFLHYRIIDVSTVKELCIRWNPDLYNKLPKKQCNHRALQDIQESVDELRFYMTNIFKITEHF